MENARLDKKIIRIEIKYNNISRVCYKDKKRNITKIKRVEDKLVRYSFWEGEIACSNHAYPIKLPF